MMVGGHQNKYKELRNYISMYTTCANVGMFKKDVQSHCTE